MSKITLPSRVSPDLSKLDPALQAAIESAKRGLAAKVAEPAPTPAPVKASKPAKAAPKATGRVLPDLSQPAPKPVVGHSPAEAFAAALAAMPEAERNAILSQYGISAPAPKPVSTATVPTLDMTRADAMANPMTAGKASLIGTSRIYIPAGGKDTAEYCDVLACDVGVSWGKIYPEAWIYTQSGKLRRVPAGDRILLPSPLTPDPATVAAGLIAYAAATERVLFSGTISNVWSKTVKIGRDDGRYTVANPTREEFRFSGKPVVGTPASVIARKCDIKG